MLTMAMMLKIEMPVPNASGAPTMLNLSLATTVARAERRRRRNERRRR